MLGVKVKIDAELCKGCELCIEACLQKYSELGRDKSNIVLDWSLVNGMGYNVARWIGNPFPQINGRHYFMNKCCDGCGRCYEVCPDSAIEVIVKR